MRRKEYFRRQVRHLSLKDGFITGFELVGSREFVRIRFNGCRADMRFLFPECLFDSSKFFQGNKTLVDMRKEFVKLPDDTWSEISKLENVKCTCIDCRKSFVVSAMQYVKSVERGHDDHLICQPCYKLRKYCENERNLEEWLDLCAESNPYGSRGW